MAIAAGLPGLRQLADAVYRFIAKRRHCLRGGCAVAIERPSRNWVGWAILATLVGAATVFGLAFPVSGWLWMWILAGALWVGFKFMNFRLEGGFRMVNPLYFAWVGTEAKAFRDDCKAVAIRTQLGSSLLFVALGLGILFGAVPRSEHPITVGWLGIFAMLSLFHFGIFALLTGILDCLGVAVEPIMNAPWKARSLIEFWGPRWNRAYSDWARVWIFRPLVRKFGTSWGTLAGFFASGIAHELVISLPARGGFGLPTVYFVLQAAGVLAQRRVSSFRGRVCTLVIVLIPIPILFHSLFVNRVFRAHGARTLKLYKTMDMNNLALLLTFAGIAHFGILVASATVPKALNWRENLRPLPKLIRQMFWVYGSFIALMIVCFGVISLVHTESLATGGNPLARSICGMIAIFWSIRLLVQFFVFDAKPFLSNVFYRVGYHGLTVVFVFLIAVYTWAALFPK